MESIFLPQQLYLEWTCCDSGRRFPPWGKQFLIRAVRTATCRCRLTATGRAGLNAPSAMGSIPSNATARTAGFRASCDRQNKVAPVLAGLAARFIRQIRRLAGRARKGPSTNNALRPVKSGESVKCGLTPPDRDGSHRKMVEPFSGSRARMGTGDLRAQYPYAAPPAIIFRRAALCVSEDFRRDQTRGAR